MTKPTYTHKTASGLLARIVGRDRVHPYYSVYGLVLDGDAEYFDCWRADLTHTSKDYNLTELPPYHDFAIDEPVMVRDRLDASWIKAYFAGTLGSYPCTWINGSTSWSAKDCKSSWAQCRRPTPEELKGSV